MSVPNATEFAAIVAVNVALAKLVSVALPDKSPANVIVGFLLFSSLTAATTLFLAVVVKLLKTPTGLLVASESIVDNVVKSELTAATILVVFKVFKLALLPKSLSNSLIASGKVVAVVVRVCVGSTNVINLSLSESSSLIAVETVLAVVPIAPAVIVPSSASNSLMAPARLESSEVVRVARSPTSSEIIFVLLTKVTIGSDRFTTVFAITVSL